MNLIKLPKDIRTEILYLLSYHDILSLIFTSKTVYNVFLPDISDYLKYVKCVSLPFFNVELNAMNSYIDSTLQRYSDIILIDSDMAKFLSLPNVLEVRYMKPGTYKYTEKCLSLWFKIYNGNNKKIFIDDEIHKLTLFPKNTYVRFNRFCSYFSQLHYIRSYENEKNWESPGRILEQTYWLWKEENELRHFWKMQCRIATSDRLSQAKPSLEIFKR